jgi:hypothetical protein
MFNTAHVPAMDALPSETFYSSAVAHAEADRYQHKGGSRVHIEREEDAKLGTQPQRTHCLIGSWNMLWARRAHWKK